MSIGKLPPLREGWQRIFLCRHGETTSNAENLLCGSGVDSSLSALGVQQAQMLARSFDGTQLDLVVSSALARSKETAKEIMKRQKSLGCQCASLELKGLNEMAYGVIDGLPLKQVRRDLQILSQAWGSGETSMKVGGDTGENPDEVIERGSKALWEVAGRNARLTAIVAHSNFNKIMLSVVPEHGQINSIGVGRMFEIQQANCCVNVIDVNVKTQQQQRRATNLVGHLEGKDVAEENARL